MRASLAVPSAESPSTMNSSLRSTSLLRQSASFAGSDDGLERVLAPLGLPVLAGGDPGPDAATTFSSTARACALSARLVEVRNFLSSALDHLAHDRRRRRRAEHLLGLALELRLGQPDGHDRGQPLEHVVLDDVVLAGLERRCRAAPR